MFCSITMHRQRRTCLCVESSSGGDLFGLSLLPDYNKWYCWSKLEYVTHFWDLRNASIYINVNLISYTPLITNSLPMRTKFATVHRWWKRICQVYFPVLTKYGCSYKTRTTSLGSKMIWSLYLIFPIFMIFPSFFAIFTRYLFPGQSRCLTGTPPQETRASGHIMKHALKSTSVSVCFRGISRLPSAFVFFWWFKLAHISIQACTFHDGCKQGIDQQILNMKSISRKITHPQSLSKFIRIRTEDASFYVKSISY